MLVVYFRENFGTNPDHARNSLTNCGIRQPEYGDRRIHYMNTRKRGEVRCEACECSNWFGKELQIYVEVVTVLFKMAALLHVPKIREIRNAYGSLVRQPSWK
jgi:hypothetical protein